MFRSVSRVAQAGAPMLLAAAMLGCSPSPIGDPCVPETIPAGGYDEREIYVETGSVQCRTRQCMVYKVQGDPLEPCDEPGADPNTCARRDAIENQIFCTCRCSVPAGGQANTPLCSCPDGFTCVDDAVTSGGAGVVGGYCVPCRRPGDTTSPLDPTVFGECPTAS